MLAGVPKTSSILSSLGEIFHDKTALPEPTKAASDCKRKAFFVSIFRKVLGGVEIAIVGEKLGTTLILMDVESSRPLRSLTRRVTKFTTVFAKSNLANTSNCIFRNDSSEL